MFSEVRRRIGAASPAFAVLRQNSRAVDRGRESTFQGCGGFNNGTSCSGLIRSSGAFDRGQAISRKNLDAPPLTSVYEDSVCMKEERAVSPGGSSFFRVFVGRQA